MKKILLPIIVTFLLVSSLTASVVLVKKIQETRKSAQQLTCSDLGCSGGNTCKPNTQFYCDATQASECGHPNHGCRLKCKSGYHWKDDWSACIADIVTVPGAQCSASVTQAGDHGLYYQGTDCTGQSWSATLYVCSTDTCGNDPDYGVCHTSCDSTAKKFGPIGGTVDNSNWQKKIDIADFNVSKDQIECKLLQLDGAVNTGDGNQTTGHAISNDLTNPLCNVTNTPTPSDTPTSTPTTTPTSTPTSTPTPTTTPGPGCWDLCNLYLPNSCLSGYICADLGTYARCVKDTPKCLPTEQNSDCTCSDKTTPTPTNTPTNTPSPTATLTPTNTPTGTITPQPTTTATPTRIKLPDAGFEFPLQGLVLVGSIISLLGILILL